MRILCLTPWFPARRDEKEGNFILDSVEALHEHGHKLSVLVTRAWRPAFSSTSLPRSNKDEIDPKAFGGNFRLQNVKYLSIPRNRLRWVSNIAYAIKVTSVLERLARDFDAELIHVHTEMPAILAVRVARKIGIPCVVTLHGINPDPRLNTTQQRSLLRETLNQADRVVLVGEPLADYFGPICGRTDHFRIVYNGFRIPATSANSSAEWHSPVRLISVSNLHEGKGIDINLRALSQLNELGYRNWIYTVVGGGYERDHLQAMTFGLGLDQQVSFTGPCDHQQVFRCLAESDVFILPSYREAFGIAYLEAMASGLLTIGVRGQGPEAFIKDSQTGFLIEPRNVQSLLQRLKDVLDNPGAMRCVAMRGKDYARSEFTWQKHAWRLTQIFQEID